MSVNESTARFGLVRVRVRGRGLVDLTERLAKTGPQLAYHFAQRVEAYAKDKVPVRTGVLKDSIIRERISNGVHSVTVNAFYGIYVNYGTRYMRAQPFWEPAIEMATEALRKEGAEMLHG